MNFSVQHAGSDWQRAPATDLQVVGRTGQEVSLNQLDRCNFSNIVSSKESNAKQWIFKPICRTTPVQDATLGLRQLSISGSTDYEVQKSVSPSREFKCTECGISVTGEASLQEHMKGKSNQAMVSSSSKKGQDQVPVSGSGKGKPDVLTNTFMCEVCDVALTSEVDLNNHMGGKKHQTKLANLKHAEGKSLPQIPATSPSQRETIFECQLCEISMTGEEDLRAHKGGKKHQAKLASTNLTGGAKANPQTLTSKQPTRFHCLLCDLTLTGPVDLENHKAGKAHQTKLTQGLNPKKEDPERHFLESNMLRCNLCNVKFTGDVDLRAHMAGKKHKAKLGAAKG